MKKLTNLFTACILSCLLLIFSAFPAFADEMEIDQESLNAYVQSVVEQVTATAEDQFDDTISYYEQAGYTGIAEGFTSWKNVKDSAGALVSVNDCVMSYGDDGTALMSATVVFENKSLNLSIQLDASGYVTSFVFSEGSAENNTGSLLTSLKDAGVNLVVGMGTVFAVLIFLCWVISLFKHISVFEKKLADRKNRKSAEKEEPAPAQNRGETVSVSPVPASDSELQAVIAAAIAAYEAEEGCTIEKQPALNNGIIIKTYRRN